MAFEVVRTWALLAAMLFLGSLVHEDGAILVGGYLVVDAHLPAAVAGLSLFGGVVFGDCAIYGLGRLARRNARLGKLLQRFCGVRVGPWLSKRLFWVVVGCRLTPTMLFPAFTAIGWAGVPFRRFFGAVVVSACLYVPGMLVAVLVFGTALEYRLRIWGWPVIAAGMAAMWVLRRRAGSLVEPTTPAGTEIRAHRGMPPLKAEDLRVALAEKISPPLYYLPLVVQWLWLGLRYRSQTLPTVANPSIEAGGLLGESKYDCLRLIDSTQVNWVARSARIDTVEGIGGGEQTRRLVLAAMEEAGLGYPVVAKPDIGWRGIGVRRLDDDAATDGYLAAFPLGQRLVIQEYVPLDGEAAVFYVRHPAAPRGWIFSLTFRYFPFVVGDGKATLRELILANPRTRWKAPVHLACHAAQLARVPSHAEVVRLSTVGSNRVGGLYIDGRAQITPAMTDRFESIVRSMPEFWFGRFDLRFDCVERLQAGEGFLIVEVNGAGSEAVHIWDPNMSLAQTYRTLFRQQSLMFAIADANRRRGFAPLPIRGLVACQQRQQRLLKRYPASN